VCKLKNRKGGKIKMENIPENLQIHISRLGIRWLEWNIDKAGLLDIILEELGLISQKDSTDDKLIPDPESNTTSEISDIREVTP
jgi:hypothetical protein